MCRLREKKREIILGLFLLDQFLKFISLTFGFGFVNRGISFGWFPWISPLVFIILNLLLIATFFKFRQNPFAAAVIAGGVSNLFDRVIRGGVVDYIGLWSLPVFNLADALIVFGAVLFVVDLSFAKKI